MSLVKSREKVREIVTIERVCPNLTRPVLDRFHDSRRVMAYAKSLAEKV
jgi:hypothetical protein